MQPVDPALGIARIVDGQIVEPVAVQIRHQRPPRGRHVLPDGAAREARSGLSRLAEQDADLVAGQAQQQVAPSIAVPVPIDRGKDSLGPTLLEVETDRDRVGPGAREPGDARPVDPIDAQLDLRRACRQESQQLDETQADPRLHDLEASVSVEIHRFEHAYPGSGLDPRGRSAVELRATAFVCEDLGAVLAAQQRSEAAVEHEVREAISIEVARQQLHLRGAWSQLLFQREGAQRHRARRLRRQSGGGAPEHAGAVAGEGEDIGSSVPVVVPQREARPCQLRVEEVSPRGRGAIERRVVGLHRERQGRDAPAPQAHEARTLGRRQQDLRLVRAAPSGGRTEEGEATGPRWQGQERVERDRARGRARHRRQDADGAGGDQEQLVAGRWIDLGHVHRHHVVRQLDDAGGRGRARRAGREQRQLPPFIRRTALRHEHAQVLAGLRFTDAQREHQQGAPLDPQLPGLEHGLSRRGHRQQQAEDRRSGETGGAPRGKAGQTHAQHGRPPPSASTASGVRPMMDRRGRGARPAGATAAPGPLSGSVVRFWLPGGSCVGAPRAVPQRCFAGGRGARAPRGGRAGARLRAARSPAHVAAWPRCRGSAAPEARGPARPHALAPGAAQRRHHAVPAAGRRHRDPDPLRPRLGEGPGRSRAAEDGGVRAPEPTVDRGTRRRAEKEADGLLKAGHPRQAAETLIESGRFDRAVDILVRAEEFVRAAEVRQEQNRPGDAAELFERAGRFESAGAIYLQQGELVRAAEAYVKAGRFSVAAELFEKQGDHRKAADAYTQVGFHRHAAQAYVRCQQWEKAAASLEQVISEEGQRLGGQDQRKQKELRTLVLQAGKLFEQAGKHERAETVLERGGCVVAAAEMAAEAGALRQGRPALRERGAADARGGGARPHRGDEGGSAAARRVPARSRRRGGSGPLLEESGDLSGAGDLLRRLERYAEAAACYERQGDSAAAAEMFRLAGDPLRAAGAYEKGDLLRDAAACFGEAGEFRRQAELLARAGEFLAAGEIFHREGMDDEAITVLQRVEPDVTGFGQASALLGSIFRAKDSTRSRSRSSSRPSETPSSPATTSMPTTCWRRSTSWPRSGAKRSRSTRRSWRSTTTTRTSRHRLAAAARAKAVAAGAAGLSAASMRSIQATGQSGRYQIVGELGRGGMGIVYKAQDTILDRIVAFKVLPEALKENPQAVANFLREAKSAAKLNHPNIVTVYDAGEQDGRYYIAMEYVDGTTLKEILRRAARSPRPASSTSWCRSARHSPTRTRRRSCTATSSRRTRCGPGTRRPRSWTSVSPRSSKRCATTPPSSPARPTT